MKLNMILYAVACLFVVSCSAILISKAGDLEPLPIEIKPVLVTTRHPVWTIRNDTGTHVVAYYQRVKMPDGTTQESKSRTPLEAKQWQVLSQKQWNAQVAAELNKPKPCTRCGGTGVEP
mgnify:CR=1 FL=1